MHKGIPADSLNGKIKKQKNQNYKKEKPRQV